MIFTYENMIQWFVRLFVAFTALPIHEFAHGFVADKLGDHTARNQGRLNINPFIHMDIFGTICLILTGFGWAKPVQINPRNFRNPKAGMALSAAAGPLSNILFAFFTLVLAKICVYLPFDTNVLSTLFNVFGIMTTVNISLAIFNLIPVPPLDGSRILNLFLPERIYFSLMRYEMFIFIGLFAILMTGILNGPLMLINSFLFNILDFLTGFVDAIARLF